MTGDAISNYEGGPTAEETLADELASIARAWYGPTAGEPKERPAYNEGKLLLASCTQTIRHHNIPVTIAESHTQVTSADGAIRSWDHRIIVHATENLPGDTPFNQTSIESQFRVRGGEQATYSTTLTWHAAEGVYSCRVSLRTNGTLGYSSWLTSPTGERQPGVTIEQASAFLHQFMASRILPQAHSLALADN